MDFNGNSSNINYDGNGNITDKFDLGTYSYQTSKPHAVSSVTTWSNAEVPAEFHQYVEYNSENNLRSIQHQDEDKYYVLYYGGLSQRIKSELEIDQQVIKTKYFALGHHEKIIDQDGTTTRDYIGLPDGTTLILQDINGNGTEIYYALKDHIGSIVAIINENGSIHYWNGEEQRYSYDAWGRRRQPDYWTYYSTNQELMFDRGYTGHEYLDAFALINMNGRTYDPTVGRFLMPDNYVQGGTQGFNRYSYCLNNPLIYTDPDGEVAWFVPIIIGATVGVTTNGIYNLENDQAFFHDAGKAAVIGGISGAFSYGIGQAAMGMSGSRQVAFQMLAHGHLGGVMSGMNGGTYGQGFLSGAAGSLIGGGASSLFQNSGPVFQAIGTVSAGALAGGIGAEITGGNFWDGARNGAISAGLNHFAHQAFYDAQLKKMYNVYKKSVEDYPTADAFYEYIGGPLGNWAGESPAQFQNTCAARLSNALNYGGFEIPEGTAGTYLGGDGKYYFINAKAMTTYLSNTKVWGMPTQARNYSNVRNAVISQTGFTGGVTGHLDIIYRGTPANHIYQTTTFYWH